MCITSDQKNALSTDQAFGAELRSSYAQDVGEAQGIFASVNNALENIVAAGPSQQGETAQELAAKNSQVISNAAAANKNINASIRQRGALSGAAPGVMSGATEGALAGSEAKIENNLSNQEAAITTENYDIGRQNFENAVKGEMALPAATMNPITAQGEAINKSNEITAEEANYNAQIPTLKSTLLGLAGGVVGGVESGLTGGLSSGFKGLTSGKGWSGKG